MRNDAFWIGEAARKYDRFERYIRRIIIVRSDDTIIVNIDDGIIIASRHFSLLIILAVFEKMMAVMLVRKNFVACLL